MTDETDNKVLFVDSIDDSIAPSMWDDVVHILCLRGTMSFTFRDKRYNVAASDYVILTNVALATSFARSTDFEGLIFRFPESYVTPMALRSNYGVIGHLSLLRDPVMRLSPRDFEKCKADLSRLRERSREEGHLFKEEMVGHLLMAHILDLYDIHARDHGRVEPSERVFALLSRFIKTLYQEDCAVHRDLSHYASLLCVTPHYLSEICKKTSGRPASYWIDRFALRQAVNLLCCEELPLSEVAFRMGFSSPSHFSRYVKRLTGLSPSEYRNSLFRQDRRKRNPSPL